MGLDLRNQMDQIRPILGFCPQVDILLEDFTVEEHLKLVAMVNFYIICFRIVKFFENFAFLD